MIFHTLSLVKCHTLFRLIKLLTQKEVFRLDETETRSFSCTPRKL